MSEPRSGQYCSHISHISVQYIARTSGSQSRTGEEVHKDLSGPQEQNCACNHVLTCAITLSQAAKPDSRLSQVYDLPRFRECYPRRAKGSIDSYQWVAGNLEASQSSASLSTRHCVHQSSLLHSQPSLVTCQLMSRTLFGLSDVPQIQVGTCIRQAYSMIVSIEKSKSVQNNRLPTGDISRLIAYTCCLTYAPRRKPQLYQGNYSYENVSRGYTYTEL